MVIWQDLIKLLRCISKTYLSKRDVDFILHFYQREVPWENLVALAEMEGVTGFLFYHLKNLGLLASLPKSFTGPIENTYRQTRQHTLTIIAEVQALSARFKETGIPVVALQGLSLLSVYGDPGLRRLGDADLLVKPGYKQRIKRLLWEAEYRIPTFMYTDLLYKNGIWLDIHTHILNLDRIQRRSYLFPEDLTPMWEKAVLPFSNQSDGLLLLDPYDNFIALAAHALKHSYSRLIWLSDMHESLLQWGNKPNGWEEIVDRARFWRQEKVVLYALILIESIFDLKVPFRVKSELGIQRLNILEKHLLRLKLRGFSSNELCIGLWLCNIKGAGKKLKFIKETLFPKEEVMAQIFNPSSHLRKKSAYAKRIVQAITLLSKNLRQALTFSFRAGVNG